MSYDHHFFKDDDRYFRCVKFFKSDRYIFYGNSAYIRIYDSYVSISNNSFKEEKEFSTFKNAL